MRVQPARLSRIVLVVGMVALVASCGSSSSGEVTIDTFVSEDGGSFTATGSMICEAGEISTIASDIGETLWVFEDVFRCADNSGSFTLRGEVPLNDSNRHLPATSGQAFDGGDDGPISDLEGTWTITAGTGDYGNLEGGGTMVMDFSPDYVESYEGELNEADE